MFTSPVQSKNQTKKCNAFEQFSDLLELYIACDSFFVCLFVCFCLFVFVLFFVEGYLNFHFDNPSDPCTAALNVAGNLSLEQSVNAAHRRGHIVHWLIMNRATDVLDLTVADMLLSDHFVISFYLLLRKPGRVRKICHVTSDLLMCMFLVCCWFFVVVVVVLFVGCFFCWFFFGGGEGWGADGHSALQSATQCL